MLIFSLLACFASRKITQVDNKPEPMGIITLLDRASENIKYVGQDACRRKPSYGIFENSTARFMFFESEIGSVISLQSCSGDKIHVLEIYPKHLRMHFKIYYGEWGIVGFIKENSKWIYSCEHSECTKFLSPEEKEMWLRDYRDFNEVIKTTYVLRSRIPVRK